MPQTPRSLSLSLCGFTPSAAAGENLREVIPWVRATGFAAVHLNAAAAGIRPRDLDRSARRDLAAIIRREGLDLSGADLWIPPEHFTEASNSDRAVTAVQSCIEYIAEIAGLVRGIGSAAHRPVLSIALPPALADSILLEIAAAADRAGVRIADHTVPLREANQRIEPAIGIGIDPAALLASGLDPAGQVFALGTRVASARLSDVSRSIGGGRIVPGSREGKLDLLGYSVALATSEFAGHIIADLRSLPQPEAAAAGMLETWRESAVL
jgi:sugar phosphate isomerase/epimerase